jgi:hypothetical protein
MHSLLKKGLGVLGILLLSSAVKAQSTFYDLATIQKIEIQFSQSDWDYQMDTAKAGAEGYIMADWVKLNGEQFDSVGVKYKGNSSYNASNTKNPLHIALDEYVSQQYQGISDIKLGNGYSDPSFIREVLSYEILSNYMECPRANFAQVYINGEYYGVYSNAESISKQFCSERFGVAGGTLVKCNPVLNPSPSNKSNLKYISGADSTGYYNYYEIKSNYGWAALKDLCDSVTNTPSSLDNVVDVDRFIWMLAFNNVLVNLDSYSGAFCQNYYLYRDNTNRFNPIVWDLNMAFGGFPNLGSGNSSMGSLTLANMQQMPLNIHSTDAYWPIIKDVQANPMFKRMYLAHVKTIVNEMFASGEYLSLASSLQAVVDTAVQSDVNAPYTYTQFQGGLTTSVNAGPFTIPGISTLMDARVTYLQSTTDWNYTAPVISNIVAGPEPVVLNQTIAITANVSGSTAVYLGYRFNVNDRFIRIPMYDDGAHDDGAAGDLVFGANAVMNSLFCQYYVYAENAEAGMFSPQRAEFEYYSLNAQTEESESPLVINEFMASNTSTITDEAGEFEDWIELHNSTSTAIDLTGMFLTDNPLNLSKWDFPAGSIIPAGGYYILWADEDSSQGINHTNFKLSAAGETLYLLDANMAFVDSVSWGLQSSDRSMARIPNGTGPFVSSEPSYNAFNPEINSVVDVSSSELLIYPNPARDYVSIRQLNTHDTMVLLLDATGKCVRTQAINGQTDLSLSGLEPGLYFLRSESFVKKLLIVH